MTRRSVVPTLRALLVTLSASSSTSRLCAATIVVMRSGETEEVAAQRAIRQLQRVEARLAGIVLNGISARFDQHYNYYSYSRDIERTGRSLRQRITRAR